MVLGIRLNVPKGLDYYIFNYFWELGLNQRSSGAYDNYILCPPLNHEKPLQY